MIKKKKTYIFTEEKYFESIMNLVQNAADSKAFFILILCFVERRLFLSSFSPPQNVAL